jgi:hypothetical protein
MEQEMCREEQLISGENIPGKTVTKMLSSWKHRWQICLEVGEVMFGLGGGARDVCSVATDIITGS